MSMASQAVAPLPAFSVGQTHVSLLTPERLIETLSETIASGQKRRVIFCNVSTVVESSRNPELRDAVNYSEVVSPDGMPLVWVAKLRGSHDVSRVDGPSSMKLVMRHGIESGWRHYLYGGTPSSLPLLADNLQREMPGLTIAGADAPPFRDLTSDETVAAMERINRAEPHFVWVGLGMPKQELWMARHRHLIEAPILLGVGAAFDFHAGIKRRAPGWMQRSGLEWLHRLASEPRRLGKRYLNGNARFFMLVAQDLARDRIKRIRRKQGID
jgi:N-acetylglucosaminyldiphosphoundecaprenol N-acetyl-beta-D-mannosaminyltransferase